MVKLFGCIDIGGTKIMTGIVDEQGNLLSCQTFPTLAACVSDTMDRIIELLKNQCLSCEKQLEDLSGIGIVCAGPVDTIQGTVENPYTLPGWDHYPIVKIISERSGLPVKLENDVNGALLGELYLKKLTGKRVLMIAFGTGIGAAFWASDSLYRTGSSFHPEFGHMVVDPLGDPCYCGQRGCFESLWSGTALHKRAKSMGFQDFNDLYRQGKSGCETANAFIKKISSELSTALWNIGILLKPEVVILGGGIMNTYFALAKEILENGMQDRDDFVPPYEIIQADPNYNPALLGAMTLFL